MDCVRPPVIGRLLVALALAALAASAVEAHSASPAAGAVCSQVPPAALHAKGQFTMMLRVNQMDNVETYVNRDEATGGLGDRIREQDIFVINTRFDGSTPIEQAEMVATLRAAFPCNRIIALNGLGTDPTQPGYLFALAGHSPYAVALDWEPNDWGHARVMRGRHGMPRWTYKFRPTLHRIHHWMRTVSRTLATVPAARRTRTGLVPAYVPHWDYGRTAQQIDRANKRLGGRHLGPHIVQAQWACKQGSRAFAHHAGRVRRQYRFRLVTHKVTRGGKSKTASVRRKFRKRSRPEHRNLALEISFSDTPVRRAALPIRSTSASNADNCLRTGIDHGVGAFFFFASDVSMRLLFAQPTLGSLRPADT